MNRPRRSIRTLVAAGTLALSGTAFAGYKGVSPVTIDTAARYAFAALGSARNSANAVEFLYCGVTISAASASGSCFAKNAAGTSVSCATTDPALVDAIKVIDESSWVRFDYDAGGNCTQLIVTHGSQYAPK